MLIRISLADSVIDVPPYKELWKVTENYVFCLQLNFSNYIQLFTDSIYFTSFITSLYIATLSTAMALIIGYPFAYVISTAHARHRKLLVIFVIMPFWTSYLIRIYSWMTILSPFGLINNILLFLHIIEEPLLLSNNLYAVCLGIVYSYLPFMVLPIYAVLDKMDKSLLEAAYDLGCRPLKAFWSVTLPLSKSGIYAGTMLVFIPAMGEAVIPELLGSSDSFMIGRVLWIEFFQNHNWPVASALAIVLICFVVLPTIILQKRSIIKYENS